MKAGALFWLLLFLSQVALLTPSSLAKVERDCHLKCHLQQPLQRLIFSVLTQRVALSLLPAAAAVFLKVSPAFGEAENGELCECPVATTLLRCLARQFRQAGKLYRQNGVDMCAHTALALEDSFFKRARERERERVAGRAERVYSSQWFTSTATVILSTCRHYPPLPL